MSFNEELSGCLMEKLTQAELVVSAARMQTSPDVVICGFQSCIESRSLELWKEIKSDQWYEDCRRGWGRAST